MIGGNGERRTLRLVARYADACNFLVLEPDEIRAKLEVLRAHCDEIGRDFREIEITALDEVDLRPGRMSPADVVARARAQADAGVQHLIVNMPEAWDVRHLELIGREVVPELERRRRLGDLRLELFHQLAGDVEVGVDVLDVVEVLEELDELEHLPRGLRIADLDRRRRLHRQLGRLRLVSRIGERAANGLEVRRFGGHDDRAGIGSRDIGRAGIDRGERDLVGVASVRAGC